MLRKKLTEQIEKISKPSKILKTLTSNKTIKKNTKKNYKIDLRVLPPSNLGPFTIAGLSMAPTIIKLCKVKKIDVIGIIDKFQGEFVEKLKQISSNHPLTIITGLDLQVKVDKYEDIILTCFFDEDMDSSKIKEFLGLLNVNTSCYGKETYPTNLPLDLILEHIDAFDGFAIPSRIDKTPNRKCAIPFLVERYGFRTFELVYQEESKAYFKKMWPKEKFNLFSFSNANALAQIGNRIEKIKLDTPNFSELKDFMIRIPSEENLFI